MMLEWLLPFRLCFRSLLPPSRASNLVALPSGAIIYEPMRLESYATKFPSSFEARRFRPMHVDGSKLVFVDAQTGWSHDTGLEAWYERLRAFHWNDAVSAGGDVTLLHMPNIRAPRRLAKLDVSWSRWYVAELPDFVEFYCRLYGLEWLYDKLPFLRQILQWGRNCYFNRSRKTLRWPVFSGWYKMEMFAVPSARRLLLYSWVPQRLSG